MGVLVFYDIEFKNKQLDDVLIRITDRETYDPVGDNTVETISLLGVAPALELETFNVNEDKFSPIIGQRATIRFKSTDTVNFSTFARGEDYRFFVRVSTGSSILFNGWLVMDDNQQAFLPAGQTVTLTATDNFGVLKDIELTDFDGERPSGKYRLIEIICWCLRKTEGPYPGEGAAIYDGIKVAMNLFEFNHHSTVDNCPLNQTYVDIKTFEIKVGELEDCHTVLTKILTSLMCRVCQYNNYWYILRIDEYKNSAFVIHNYGLGGNYISRTLGATLDKEIDSNVITFIEAQTLQRIQRPYKSSELTADFELPEEIVCNIDFIRGDFIADMADEVVDGVTYTVKKYELDCWTMKHGPPTSPIAPTVTPYIKRRFSDTNYEAERFIVIPDGSDFSVREYLESEPIPLAVRDKFTFSIDWRLGSDISLGSGFDTVIAKIVLHGEDGSWWALGGNLTGAQSNYDDPENLIAWYDTSGFTTNTLAGLVNFNTNLYDETDWQTQTWTGHPLPVSGDVYIWLFPFGSPSDNFEVEFQNASFDYTPYINGGYRRYSGESFKMSSEDKYAKKYEQQYYLFDAPRKLHKGALHYFDSPNYLLTSQWVDFAMEQYAIPDLLDFGYAFLHWQTNAVWNQNRLETWILNSYFYGLDVANGYASPIHKYSMPAQLSPLNRMNFLILSMRQNWHDCTWQATIAEINDSDSVRQGGEGNGENFEFKYIEEN